MRSERAAGLNMRRRIIRCDCFLSPGFDECVVRFTTDVPYLSQWGKPLLLGPGSILDAHTDHERISKRELEESIDLYVRVAKKLATDERG